MSLMPIISLLGNIGLQDVVTPPFNDTIEFNVDSIVDSDPRYYYLGNYLQNPINKKVLHVFSNGDEHLWTTGRKISIVTSLDEGQTFGSIIDLYDPADGGTVDVGPGYDSNGRLHCFVSVRNNRDITLATLNELRYFYSDDDGATISTPVVIPDPSDSLLGSWPTGRVIENNGVLFKNYYRIDSGAANSANYLLRSTDGGANWTNITIRAEGTNYYNEADIIALSNTDLLVLFRDEVNNGWQQYRSDDNGLTWASDGNTDFGEVMGATPRPPSLRSFNVNNQRVIAIYSLNANTQKNFVVYAKASDLISSGLSGWNLNTKLYLLENTGQGGYNNEVHFDNTLRAIMYNYEDQSLSTTITTYMTLSTTHYQDLITELGL